ncbi:hypothetical protein K9N08_00270 [Candidatus Gracilibacteria bacterium]|nr:hypothetical protein [Candidatus Gracilibacteria bacterium]MCF7855983.1 hypothetical protein [Candidatus Gracilibacteria bacterium]MCF7896324.1 hypothetical protein [Candidatus Gracilibacteria bacterium]
MDSYYEEKQHQLAKNYIQSRDAPAFASLIRSTRVETFLDTNLVDVIKFSPKAFRNKLRGEIEKVIHASSEREKILQTLGLQKTVTELEKDLAVSDTTIKGLEAKIRKQQSLIFSQLLKIAATEEADKTRKIIKGIMPDVNISDYAQTRFFWV